MRREIEKKIEKLFLEQKGLATRSQLLECGLHPRALTRRVTSGEWAPAFAGVYRVAPLAPPEQTLLAACLAVGGDAVASHRAAAWLHGFSGFAAPAVEVATTTNRKAGGVVFHRVRSLAGDIGRVRDIPVTLPARTLADLGDVVPPKRVAAALDDALRRKLVRHGTCVRVLDGLGTKGRRGATILRKLLDERGPEVSGTESDLEALLATVFRRHGLPLPKTQFKLWIEEQFVARIDFAYPDARIAIFTDGWAFHSDRPAFEHDREQQNTLAAHGWTVLRYTWARIKRHGDAVATEIRDALARAAGRELVVS